MTTRSTLRCTTLAVEGAAHPAGSGLPILHGIDVPTPGGEDFDPELRRNLAYGRPSTLLPYTLQDTYDRNRAPRELPAVVLENDTLTATFLPGLGGRLWSLEHRPSGRELLHRNPVFQPANLALRDAWFAGGVEWNLGTTGHWPLTCEPLHAVRLTASDGTPVLRMFEFERLRRLVVQIDAWLPADSPVLLVHLAVHNPSETEVPVYWWSNTAVPQTDRTRVVAPADHAYHFDHAQDLRHVPFPDFRGHDRSYPGRLDGAADYFLDLPDGEPRWITALDEHGTGLAQASTATLRGRKLFHWGTATGGRRWQEWLSGPDAPYLEIQAGLARTQLEHLPLPARTTWDWTEAYGLLHVDPLAAHGSWDRARAAAGRAVHDLMPPALLDAARTEARNLPHPATEPLGRASGWGALEIAAGTLRPHPGLPFGPCTAEQRPWLHLLQHGRLPVSDPPAPAVTGPTWHTLLETTADDWHAHYHLGLLRLAADDPDGARDAWHRSLADRRTPWALRCLAHLDHDPDLLLEAHRLRPDLRQLTVETLESLLTADRPAEALALLATLPEPDRRHGRIRLLEARAALATADHPRAARLLAEGITVDNLKEGEPSLDTLWHTLHPDRPVPAAYDFRMS